MKTKDKSKLVEVFKGSLWQAELLKTMLGDNGVECTTLNALVVNMGLPETVMDVAVVVNKEHYQEAMEVVLQYEKNLNVI